MFRKFRNLFLIWSMILFGLICVGCTNSKGEFDMNNENNQESTYYMDVIDLSSSITYDYMNPNYGFVSLDSSSSYVYVFNGKQVYDLISSFNTIPINHIISKNIEHSELMKKIIEGIDVEVSYKYMNSNAENDDAFVHFYILIDGTLVFEDNRKLMLFYSESNVVDYEEFKSKVILIGGRGSL